MEHKQLVKDKTCPRCGAHFVCTHDAYCQCAGVKLTENARAYLRTHYDDCLCRKCLENLSLTLSSREGKED